MSSQTVILSPHFDDAVLSCWHLLDRVEGACVVNVFAGVPQGDVAGWWDAANGSEDSARVVQERIEEDRAALRCTGLEPINLGFLDDQYRDAEQALEPVVHTLRDVIPADGSVCAPAALTSTPLQAGRDPHPDHLIVRAAAIALRAEGLPVWLYADLPHASAHGWPEWVTDVGGNPAIAELWAECLADAGLDSSATRSEVRRLPAGMFKRKAHAVRQYSSQLKLIEESFGCPADDRSLIGYEVLWRLP